MEELWGWYIHPLWYFYPSLSELPYLQNPARCQVSEDLAQRVSCLLLFHDLGDALSDRIAKRIIRVCGPLDTTH
ncbi:MAG: hypothetical protein KDC03_00625 [Flavobacteriales bacterium]|nr:hypothetical protein [Flavobacteriales bacterium]